jgi:hypothetical protein
MTTVGEALFQRRQQLTRDLAYLEAREAIGETVTNPTVTATALREALAKIDKHKAYQEHAKAEDAKAAAKTAEQEELASLRAEVETLKASISG